jgi:glycosyltransferase involved in cell wall biosynthesis
MVKGGKMRITYICRSFLDYRVPVFEELSHLLNGDLTVLYSETSVPERVRKRLYAAIGDKAVALSGEMALGFQGNITSEFSNSRIRIPWQPGILQEIRRSEPDVIIGDGFSQWTLPALVYRVAKNVPLVVCYERTMHTERNAQWYRKLFRRMVIPLIGAFCVNGRLSREYVESFGVSGNLITTGNMAADVNILSDKHRAYDDSVASDLREKIGISLGAIIYLSVSKLIKLKGIYELLQGWKEFRLGDEKQVHLLVVGEGPERKILEKNCKENGLCNVTFIGTVDYDEMYKYYGMSDVFVIPTLEDNWSLVVPEAMSCGLPILCSKYNGCWPELVTSENGWVFDPLDVEDTVNRLKNILSVKNTFPKMGQKSLEIVKNHTPRHAAQAILDACRIAISD